MQRYPVMNLRPRPQLGGLLEDYQNEINHLKDQLYHGQAFSGYNPPPMQYPPSNPPANPPPPPGPATQGGATYFGPRPGPMVATGSPKPPNPNDITVVKPPTTDPGTSSVSAVSQRRHRGAGRRLSISADHQLLSTGPHEPTAMSAWIYLDSVRMPQEYADSSGPSSDPAASARGDSSHIGDPEQRKWAVSGHFRRGSRPLPERVQVNAQRGSSGTA